MMGQPDDLLRVAVRDAAEHEAFYIDVLASLPLVRTLTSMTTMKTIKRNLRAGRTSEVGTGRRGGDR